MNDTSISAKRVAAFCRALLRVVSCIVPPVRRDEWRAEWNAELWELCHRAERVPARYPNVSIRVLAFTGGSLLHAFAEFRQEWRADLLWYEFRQAMRFLARNRVFSITSALLIALGVGANTTVFTLVNAVLLRAPQGIEAPNELVQIGRVGTDERNFNSWSYPLFVDFRNRSTSFAELAAYAAVDVTIGRGDDVVAGNAQLASSNYFRLLGSTVARGRAFLDEEDHAGRASVTVISNRMWQRRFALDPEVIGKTITISGRLFRIVGVARPEFTGADIGASVPDVWLPIAAYSLIAPIHDDRLNSRFMSWVWILGRLKPGIAQTAGKTELSDTFRQLQLNMDGTVRDGIRLVQGLGLRPEERALAGVVSGALLAMVGAVLIIACANLAALLLARGAARQTEFSIRLAIGASRNRVVRQLVMETLIVGVIGSATAFLFTRWTARLIETLIPYPISVSLEPDRRVLAFALLLGVLTSAVFGALPAWRSATVDMISLLRSSSTGMTNRGTRLRATLLVGQIALSFTLLGSTSLLVRTMLRASTLDPGFRTENILVGAIDLPPADGNESSNRIERLEQVVAQIRAEPGVSGAALASTIPATGTMPNRTMWPTDGDAGDPRMFSVSTLVIDTGYFHVMDVPILHGHQFDGERDQDAHTPGVVINETLANRMWPGQNAIGKTLAFGLVTGEQRVRVIGVARDTKNRSLRADPAPQVYFPLTRNPPSRVMLHVRVASAQVHVETRLARTIRETLPGTPSVHFETMRAYLASGFADVRLIGILGGAFGFLALALATVGIYGVTSYETSQCTREYGLRLALGARPAAIHSTVLRRSAKVGALGITMGVIATIALEPLLRRWVFGIAPFDPLSLAATALLLTVTIALAALGPAIRASRSDPMSSLRAD